MLGLSKSDIMEIISDAKRFSKNNGTFDLLKNKIVALAFFEPSTRTFTSFETAAKRLGANTIGFRFGETTSQAKGENVADTVRMLEAYSDCIVIRDKYDGTAKFAAEISSKSIINAGDGKHEHPTQAIQDLFTINEIFGHLENLTIGMLGDLRYSRTVNSLLRALTMFRPKKVHLISPPQLRAREEILSELNYKYDEESDPMNVADALDVLYVTRVQKERFPDEYEYERAKESYRVDKNLVDRMKPDAIVLHPLPRVNEIDRSLDRMEKAKYIMQAAMGVPVRMSILYNLIGDKNE